MRLRLPSPWVSAWLASLLLLTSIARGDDSAPVSRDGREQAASFGLVALLHADPPKAQSGAWWTRADLGASAGFWAGAESIGSGALTLSGVGDGAGGHGAAVGGQGISTVGRGGGVDAAVVDQGRALAEASVGAAARVKAGVDSLRKRLPEESIQRVVRQSFGAFRVCYEEGLAYNPHLQGRVAIKFAVDPAGAVRFAADRDSTLPDKDVVSCVVRVFLNLAFPPFEGGEVTVVYPLSFSPEEREPR